MSECEECGSRADKNWEFCPKCGSSLKIEEPRDMFSEIFERLNQEFGEMNKMTESRVEAFDLSPMFKKSKGGTQHSGGFSISIVSSGARPPQVSVRTFGDVDERKIKQQVYSQLGEVAEERPVERKADKMPGKTKSYDVTEEPKTKIGKVGEKVVVEMELPEVKKDSDIEINELESSLEVKAVAGKKAFFKILRKPENRRVVRTSFNKGILKLEFA